MREFGMPMGPFEVLDEVGLDVALKVRGVLSKAFPDRMTPRPRSTQLVAADRLGRKSGVGFYRHRGRKRERDRSCARRSGLEPARRGACPTCCRSGWRSRWSTSRRAVSRTGSRRTAGEIDLAMVFGAGFPPFRGGPLRYADTLGCACGARPADRTQRREGPALRTLRAPGSPGDRRRDVHESDRKG
jgi:3-hydroxyacyl-CoA dehydrogenase/enoyl-CoA hydratase/3-hydroxybutyryl-CoA epimerase